MHSLWSIHEQMREGLQNSTYIHKTQELTERNGEKHLTKK